MKTLHPTTAPIYEKLFCSLGVLRSRSKLDACVWPPRFEFGYSFQIGPSNSWCGMMPGTLGGEACSQIVTAQVSGHHAVPGVSCSARRIAAENRFTILMDCKVNYCAQDNMM